MPEQGLLLQEERPVGLAKEPTVMEILSTAVLNGNVAVDVIERLTKLQREQVEYQAMVEFNESMHRCQEKMKRISADMVNPQTHSRYASYAQVDRAIRPIYTAEGISLSFSEGEPPASEMIRVICYVSRGGYTRLYQKDMPIVTVGPQGKAVMTAIHAHGSADSYAKRYLVKDIFNLAIGDDDNDGNPAEDSGPGMPEDDFTHYMEGIEAAQTLDELREAHRKAHIAAQKCGDKSALRSFAGAKDRQKEALQ